MEKLKPFQRNRPGKLGIYFSGMALCASGGAFQMVDHKHRYAQTNIQLFNQLQQKEYVKGDLKKIHDAYHLATALFNRHFRPNGKSFLCHLVGTASILVAQSAEPNVVIGGLLHAAYTHGEFNDPRRGVTGRKRSRVRSVVGVDAEALVAAYANTRWNRTAYNSIQSRIKSLDTAERNVVMIRLANELEDHLDLGMLYGAKLKSYVKDHENAEIICDLAKQMGLNALADEISRAYQATAMETIPDQLLNSTKSSYTCDISLPQQLGHGLMKLMVKVRRRD